MSEVKIERNLIGRADMKTQVFGQILYMRRICNFTLNYKNTMIKEFLTIWALAMEMKSHGKCPHCGEQLGPPGTEHTCT